ncbi:cache domain-containing protein [Azotobacter chroococcum]|uniref:Integral membrane sensor signal transduction histidine kinase n=1 Tax=Azotobacter chroococcum NCIMB 8003 TaxID=1328314 RepID=A0A0C4WQ85_9GAMM|nr:cache domain-containing protein [Azotobacter chroococcum]AJE20422.1 Integral membrane sensor signal transduction histidine kinase [Azotobacter chroococcum NCIMB 8003]
MQLKHKIVALSILPLLLAVALICALVIVQNQRLGEEQVRLIENAILSSKRAELKNYVAMALSVIAPLQAGGQDDAQARRQALEALARIDFGQDGYFFVYDTRGRNLMHPRQAELVGRDLWNLTDPHGLPAVRALIESASGGDGFQRYAWQKPSTGRVTDKLAHVVMLEPWGWMLGTGIYLEDVEQATRQVREEVADGIRSTMAAIATIALVAVLLVFAGGLALSVREHRLADSKLQSLNRRIVHLQEEERSRVSRELHDGISQLLVSIKFQFELAGHQLEAGQSSGLVTLGTAIERLGGAIGEIRRISHDLRPSLLDTLGLPAAIGQLASEFEQRCGLAVVYRNGLPDARLPDGVAVALFRIVQEALTNIERHARAGTVLVELEPCMNGVQLQVQDDGIGFDPRTIEQPQEGIGLRNMRERVEHLGGRFSLSSSSGHTGICVILPVPAASAAGTSFTL